MIFQDILGDRGRGTNRYLVDKLGQINAVRFESFFVQSFLELAVFKVIFSYKAGKCEPPSGPCAGL